MKLKNLFQRSGFIGLTAFSLSGLCGLSQSITTSFLNEETDIINTGGTVISAVHFQNPTTSGDPDPLIVNGIPHLVGRSNEPLLTGNFGFEGDFRNGASGLPQDGSDIVQVLLSGIAGVNGITMEIAGLEVGKTYLFQTYWEAPLAHTLTVTLEGETIDNVTPEQDPPNGNPGGTLISYEFTATDTVFNAFLDRDDAGANTGDPNNWLSGYSLQELDVVSTDVEITSISLAGPDLWEIELKGGPETTYELRTSSTLTFDPGSLVEGLTQGEPAAGTISGATQNLVTTDSNGIGRIRLESTESKNFIIAQIPPAG